MPSDRPPNSIYELYFCVKITSKCWNIAGTQADARISRSFPMRLTASLLNSTIGVLILLFNGWGVDVPQIDEHASVPTSIAAPADAFWVASHWEAFEQPVGHGTAIDLSSSPDGDLYLLQVDGSVHNEPPYLLKGGMMQISHDSGETWSTVPLTIPDHFYPARVVFISNREGFVLIQREALRGISAEVRVLHTTDSGKTWGTSLVIPDLLANSFGMLANGNGWVVGANSRSRVPGHYVQGAGLACFGYGSRCSNIFPKIGSDKRCRNSALEDAFSSEDGKSLTILTENGRICSYSFENSALSGVTTIEAKAADPAYGMGFSKIHPSSDSFLAVRGSTYYRSNTWSKISFATRNNVSSEELFDHTYILDITGDATNGFYACGYFKEFAQDDKLHSHIANDGVVYHSEDGAHWEKIFVRSGVRQETSDGGATWGIDRAKNISSDFFALTRVRTLVDGSVLVAGSDGLIIKLKKRG